MNTEQRREEASQQVLNVIEDSRKLTDALELLKDVRAVVLTQEMDKGNDFKGVYALSKGTDIQEKFAEFQKTNTHFAFGLWFAEQDGVTYLGDNLFEEVRLPQSA